MAEDLMESSERPASAGNQGGTAVDYIVPEALKASGFFISEVSQNTVE
jgi:hypothetical protein